MSRFLPVGKGVKGAAGFLLAAIPALGAVLTGLAVTGGLVGHMARDHPLASYGAFGLAVLAIFAGALATFAFRAGSAEEPIASYAGRRATTTISGHEPGLARSRRRAMPRATRLGASASMSHVPRSGRSWRSHGRRLSERRGC